MALINEKSMDFNGMEVECSQMTATTSITAPTVTASTSLVVGSETVVAADFTLLNAITATAAELNTYNLTLDIDDGSADATYYLVCPQAGTISKIYTVIDGAVSTADITVTANIGATPITNGVVTIATAASAAGDIDSATPTAANTVTAGQAINLVVAGGGAGGSPRIHVVVEVTR